MNLIEEAVIIELFGIRMYAFGVYAALGALLAVIVLAVAGRTLGLKKGTVPLTALLSMICGLLVSRLAFCLLNRELGRLTPLSFWPQLNGGGWSMFGLIAGVYAGGWISAKIAGEKTGQILDALSLAVLPMIAAERFGESRIEDFDISRPLDSTFLNGSFLAVGVDEPCLATYYVAAAVAILLFVMLTIRFARKERDGNLTIAFLLLFGAAAIVTESLRYDRFLSITFVGLQHVSAAVILCVGVVLAACRYVSQERNGKGKKGIVPLAFGTVLAAAGIAVGLEFALDRTSWNALLVYAVYILVMAVPAVMGILLLHKTK